MKLKDYIELKRVSKTRVSRDLGISRKFLYDILQGKVPPGRKLALRIKDWSDNAVDYRDLWE